MKYIPEHPEQYDVQWLDTLPCDVLNDKHIISLGNTQKNFLNGLVRSQKPQKLMEVGVHNGGSSMLLLNAVKDDPATQCYSVDISDIVTYGPHKGKQVGWAVKTYVPELSAQWRLFTGGHAAQFIDAIGGGIDFCFLDGAHTVPGELLDFLIVLPYMQPSGIIAMHDTILDHYGPKRCMSIANSVLFAVACAEKFTPSDFDKAKLPMANIGALRITDDTWKYIDNVFRALNLKWRHLPSDTNMEYIVSILEKYYSSNNVAMFLANYDVNKRRGVKWKLKRKPNPSAIVPSMGVYRDYLESLLRQLKPLLSRQEVYFWGCGATYRKYRHLFADVKVRCILVDRPGAPQSVDGIPVRHPDELQASAEKLPVVVFSRAEYRSEIEEKLYELYNFLIAGEPVWVIDMDRENAMHPSEGGMDRKEDGAVPDAAKIVLSALGTEYTLYFSALPDEFLHKHFVTSAKPRELSVLEDMASSLKPGDLVVDVGANVGNHTMFLAALGCQVEAFEPNEKAFSLLEKSIHANNFTDRVTLHKTGVGASQGLGNFTNFPDNHLGAWKLTPGAGTIPIVDLDCIEFKQPIKILKIDVEGMEYQVLSGAKATIEKYHPIIYLEMLHLHSMERDYHLLSELGYAYSKSFTPRTHCFVYKPIVNKEDELLRYCDHKVLQVIYCQDAAQIKASRQLRALEKHANALGAKIDAQQQILDKILDILFRK